MDITERSTKTFWQRPEGKTGIFFVLAGIASLGVVGILAMPIILLALQTALHTLFLLTTIFLILIVLMNKRFQLTCKAAFQLSMRKLTGFVIELDPIGIIMNYLETLQKSLDKMSEQLDLLAGQKSKLQTKIINNEAKIENSLQKAHFAKDKLGSLNPQSSQYREAKNIATLEANKAARLKESNSKLNEVLSKITNLSMFLERTYDASKLILDDMTDDVKVKKEERDAINTGYGAFKQALKVLDGDKDEKAMFDETMEYIAEDLGNKVGKIERFMEKSGGILTNMDIEKEMFDSKGFQLIEEWENKGELLITRSLPKTEYVSVQNTSANKYLN